MVGPNHHAIKLSRKADLSRGVRGIARFSGVIGSEAYSRVIFSSLVRALYLMMS